MRELFNKVTWIEQYLFGLLKPKERQAFETKMLLDTTLYAEVIAQKNVYKLVKKSAREKLRKELDTIHNQLFTKTEKKSFQEKIKRIFYEK